MKYYNKINRNFKIKARLYFNEASHNRALDTTPRYFVKISSLKTLERIAFTDDSEDQEYLKYQKLKEHPYSEEWKILTALF